MNESEYILHIRSVQSSNIRTLFEVLKESLTEINIEVTKDHMRSISIDSHDKSLIYFILHAKNFEYYHFDHTEPSFLLGINTQYAFKIANTIKNNDTVSLYVKKVSPREFCMQIENSDKNSKSIYSMQLYDLIFKTISIDDRKVDSEISLPSTDFQKICRDYKKFGCETMEIKSIGEQVIFSGEGEFSKQETFIGESKITEIKSSDRDNIVQGVFSMEYLLLFSKATNLCATVRIYLSNNYPIMFLYNVGSLGEIRFVIAEERKEEEEEED